MALPRRNAAFSSDTNGFECIPPGIADCHKVILTYGGYVNLAPTGGAVGQKTLSGNSLFDPDVTGIGTQPYWFDQWKAMYDKYRVYKSEVEVRFTNQGAIPLHLLVVPVVTNDVIADLSDAMELKYATHRVVGSINGSGSTGVIRHKMRSSTIFGCTEQSVRDEDGYAALVSASPVSRFYWQICAQNVGAYTTTISVTCEFRIRYYAVMYSPTQTGDSVTLRSAAAAARTRPEPLPESVAIPERMRQVAATHTCGCSPH